jgi:hypothetical protein
MNILIAEQQLLAKEAQLNDTARIRQVEDAKCEVERFSALEVPIRKELLELRQRMNQLEEDLRVLFHSAYQHRQIIYGYSIDRAELERLRSRLPERRAAEAERSRLLNQLQTSRQERADRVIASYPLHAGTWICIRDDDDDSIVAPQIGLTRKIARHKRRSFHNYFTFQMPESSMCV